MPPKKTFYLIFSTNPPAGDVRNDKIISLDPCVFRHEKCKDEFEEVPGEIKLQGYKKDLDLVKLNSNGQLCAVSDPDRVGTRKQELEKLRLAQVNAQRLQLQRVAEQMLDDGADAVAEQLLPVEKKKRSPSLPKKRSQAVLAEIRDILKDMICFKPGPLKTRVYKDKPLFCDSGKLQVARLKYCHRPKQLHLAVLKLCVPSDILRLEGVRCAGKRGCVQIDPVINETISLLVHGQYLATGGKSTDKEMQYNPDEILENLIDNTRRLKGTWRLVNDSPSSTPPPSSPPRPSSPPSSSPPRPSSPPSSSSPPRPFSPPSSSSQTSSTATLPSSSASFLSRITSLPASSSQTPSTTTLHPSSSASFLSRITSLPASSSQTSSTANHPSSFASFRSIITSLPSTLPVSSSQTLSTTSRPSSSASSPFHFTLASAPVSFPSSLSPSDQKLSSVSPSPTIVTDHSDYTLTDISHNIVCREEEIPYDQY